jgi:hypothetical protein
MMKQIAYVLAMAGLLSASAPATTLSAAARVVCGSRLVGFSYYERYCFSEETGYTCAQRWYASGAYWEGCYYSPIV